MYNLDLALDNLQWLICYKTQPTNHLHVETIAILMGEWITSNSFKNLVTNKLCEKKWLMLNFDFYIAILEII